MIKVPFSIACTVLLLSLLFGCSPRSEKELKVAATPVPHAQMLEFIKPELKAQGIDLFIVIADDYNMPNRALANKEIDANFFQHIPFMDEQIKQFHYPIESIAKIELEPMGIYSKKIQSLSDLTENAKIAIPNDPTNEGRALLLFQDHGFIELDNSSNLQATILNISKNPKNLQFIEVDAAMIPRSLEDVDAAAINTNYAFEAGLSPLKDALALETKNSPYANVLAIRIEDENRPDIQALKKALTSEKMKQFILEEYKGAVLPAF
jgi:D-methionine transport system substrate-binding protein